MAITPVRVCIAGVGLIGGSLGMALRRRKKGGRRMYFVTGLGRSKTKLALAKKRGAIDEGKTNARAALEEADIVVMAMPVHRMPEFLRRNVKFFAPGAIVTDVGSVKGSVVNAARNILKKRPNISFVGGHPIAGSEKTGVENARFDLFRDAVCVLTKDDASFHGLEALRSLWIAAGSRCFLMTAADHDRHLALTSHLPHLLAFALLSQADNAAADAPVIKSLAAGSFRDMTRIAGGDPDLWTGVIESNRDEIRRQLLAFQKELRFFSAAPAKKIHARIQRIAQAKKKW